MGRARAVSWPSHLVDQRLEEGLYISTEGAPLLPRLNVLSMRVMAGSLANEPEPMGITWEGLHAPTSSNHRLEELAMLTSYCSCSQYDENLQQVPSVGQAICVSAGCSC